MGKMVGSNEAVGATVLEVGWSEVVVRTEDGRLLKIEAGEGHSGIEMNVYEASAAERRHYREEVRT